MKHPTPHTKSELLTPSRAKGQSTIGPSHTGDFKKGFLAEAGEPGLRVHHTPADGRTDMFQGHAVPGNIARDGAPKKHLPVPTHAGMTDAQHYGAKMGGGLGHPTSSAIPGANPLSPNAVTLGKEKQLSEPKITPGMRGRCSPMSDDAHFQLGRAILNSAVRNR
jgi:hypothetical protein